MLTTQWLLLYASHLDRKIEESIIDLRQPKSFQSQLAEMQKDFSFPLSKNPQVLLFVLLRKCENATQFWQSSFHVNPFSSRRSSYSSHNHSFFVLCCAFKGCGRWLPPSDRTLIVSPMLCWPLFWFPKKKIPLVLQASCVFILKFGDHQS